MLTTFLLGEKREKWPKKILRNVERRKTGLCEKSRMFDNLKASHSIVLSQAPITS